MPEMHLSPSEAQDELLTAYYTGDLERIAQLFANASLETEGATRALEDSLMEMDPALIRVLLQNCADINTITCRDLPRSGQVGELLELLAQNNYDFKRDGHRILEGFAQDRNTLGWLLDHGVDINRTGTQRLDNGFNLAPGETDWSLHLLNNNDFRDFVHDADDRGSPPCSAILNRNLGVVLELLQRGASPTYPDMRPISYAIEPDGFLPALEPLLSASVDAASALNIAVGYSNLEAARICVAFGADPARSLPYAFERVEDNMQSVDSIRASNERLSDPDYKEVLEESMAAEQNSRAMVELLSGSVGDLDA